MRDPFSVSVTCRSLAVALTATSCTTEPGCDPCFTTAIANVYVRTVDDQPVAGVGVEIRTYLHVCGLDLRGGSGGGTFADGHRRHLVASLFSPHTVRCIVLTVNPDSNPAFPRGTKEFMSNLEFRAEDGSPRDSVRLDIVVP